MATDAQNRGLVSRLGAFVAHPFSQQMDLISWMLFVSLVVIVAFGWTRVLKHITEE